MPTPTENLFLAIREENLTEIKRLIEADPSLRSARDQRGSTPLVLATYLGKDRVTEVLLASGVDVNERDGNGNTALMGLAFKGNVELAKMLIDAGADAGAKKADGANALSFAKMGNNKPMVELLSPTEG